jgi:hypothetical protein
MRGRLLRMGMLLVAALGVVHGVFGLRAWGSALGFGLGYLSFLVLSAVFAAPQVMPKWMLVAGLFVSSLKLVGLLALAWLLYRLGVSMVELIAGILLSQFGILGVIVWSLADPNPAVPTSMFKRTPYTPDLPFGT